MLKNTIYMALTTGIKMLSGILVFVVMARFLGPHGFGMVAYSFTLASLFVLIVDYGFSQQILREIGANPEDVDNIMGRVLITKLVLSIATILICAIFLQLFPKDSTTETVFWLLLISSIFASFCEFLNTAFRCVGSYSIETNIATAGSLVHLVLLLCVLMLRPDVLEVASTFVVSRLIFLGVSWGAYRKHIGKIHWNLRAEQVSAMLRSGFPYATDAGFTNFFYQVDTIIINHYLGFESLGLYQAVTKWLQGGMQFAPVLANVYIPNIAKYHEDKAVLIPLCEKFNTKMLIVGLVGGIVFQLFGTQIGKYLYGNAYQQTSGLWSAIGLLMFLRYMSGAQGTLLMASGFQKVRVTTQFFALALLLVAAPILINRMGIIGMIMALQLNVFVVFLVYMFSLYRHSRPNGFNHYKLILCGLVVGAGVYLQFN